MVCSNINILILVSMLIYNQTQILLLLFFILFMPDHNINYMQLLKRIKTAYHVLVLPQSLGFKMDI